MSKLLFLEPSWFGTGLTNQLFFIVHGIIDCITTNKNNFIINKFRLEPLTYNFCNISDVLDINHLNILLSNYNINIFDINNLIFSIDNVKYGGDDVFIDITQEIKELFYKNNRLCIPSGTILNHIKGDPLPELAKKICITYSLNNIKTTEEYSEYIYNDIIIDLQNPVNISDWKQIDNCYIKQHELFDFLLKNIKFNSRLVKYSENALLIDKNNNYINIANVDLNKKINVIHLRVEKDMTGHMIKHNNMTQEEYDEYLQDKYINLIKQYFSKDDIIFILSYDLTNNVIRFLRDNEYEFYYTKKNIFDGREKHAIIDLLIGEKCNNYFIGNWNFDIRQGSTFSYILYKRNKAYKNLFIDMYNIKQDEVINYNINNKINVDINIKSTLKNLVNNNNTDKNTTHSYLDLYEELLFCKKNTAKKILEIGIGSTDNNGGSIKLWHDYFPNAEIYGLDIIHIDSVWNEIKNIDRIKLYTETDGYNEEFFKNTFLNKNIKFDMMLDDGPHTLESMKKYIKLYSQLMTEDGILMIEDIQSMDWINELSEVVPSSLKKYIRVYDLRKNKNRYDDIVFVIDKNSGTK
jgi:hypothetical protein